MTSAAFQEHNGGPVEDRTTRHHVAFIVNNYPPKVGGVESHVSHLAASLRDLNVDVTVFALDNDAPSGHYQGIEVVRYTGTPMIGGVLSIPWPGTGRKVRKDLKRRGVTAISTHTRFFPMSFLGVRCGKHLNIPVIHTEHGSDHVRGVSRVIAYASRIVDRTMGRYILKHASQVLSISSAARDFVEELAQVQSTVFLNAISTEAFRVQGESGARAPRIVFLGRLVDGKGWQTCLAVGESLAAEFPSLEVHFIGDGAQRPLLEAAVLRSPISQRVTIHGYLGRDEIKTVLAGGILLNPTILAEGFQTTLLEAVTAGASVVSTPVAAARYLADGGAPVRILEDRSTPAWTAETRRALLAPKTELQDDMTLSFDWSTRSREYAQILDATAKVHLDARRPT